MSEEANQQTIAGPNNGAPNLDQFFGISTVQLSDEVKADLSAMNNILTEQLSDPLDRIAAIRNVEMGLPFTDDKAARIKAVLKSLLNYKIIGADFKNFASTTDDLFRHAVETGNWIPFLKHAEEKRRKLKK